MSGRAATPSLQLAEQGCDEKVISLLNAEGGGRLQELRLVCHVEENVHHALNEPIHLTKPQLSQCRRLHQTQPQVASTRVTVSHFVCNLCMSAAQLSGFKIAQLESDKGICAGSLLRSILCFQDRCASQQLAAKTASSAVDAPLPCSHSESALPDTI